jgi:hypothetical protein
VLSVKDEFYHRHIVQYDLFAPVFSLFRAEKAAAGDTLVSSAVLEVSVLPRGTTLRGAQVPSRGTHSLLV